MSLHRTLRLTQRRSVVSSLFGITFLASVVTVSATTILPCPARPSKGRYADAPAEKTALPPIPVVIAKRPKRWIEETYPQ